MSSFEPLVEANDIVDDPVACAEQYARDGYLFLRGLLDRDAVALLGEQFLGELRRQGFVDDDGKVVPGREASAFDPEPLHDAVAYQQFWESPSTISLFERVFGCEVHVFKQTLLRYMFPAAERHLLPAHQDITYIGPEDAFRTFWVPLCDMSEELGGLAVAPGSHHHGHIEHVRDSGHVSQTNAKDLLGVPADMQFGWCRAEFRMGDVLSFSPYMVHRSLPNTSGDQVRLSMDTRVQPAAAPRTPAATLTAKEIRRNALTGTGWSPR